jgi:CRP-like cAMP-binding protein
MSSTKKHRLQRLVPILQQAARTTEDIEMILGYLLSLPDLHKYLITIPRETLVQMCTVIKAERFAEGSVVFKKGDYSHRFFVILSGRVEISNTVRDGEVTFKTYLGNGKRFGEQGIITSQPRSLTAVAVEPTFMLVMSRAQFKLYLQTGFLTELVLQLTYIEKYLPSIEHYSYQQRIMIAYCLRTDTYRRGQVILQEGTVSPNLYIVIDGEAEIIADLKANSRGILKLEKGALFGEEGVLLSAKSKYSVVCASERVHLFFIRKFDADKVLPDEIKECIKASFRAKEVNRKALTEAKTRTGVSITTRVYSPASSFMWASPVSKQKLVKMQLVKSLSSQHFTAADDSFQRKKTLLVHCSMDSEFQPKHSNMFRRRPHLGNESSKLRTAVNLPKVNSTTNVTAGLSTRNILESNKASSVWAETRSPRSSYTLK